MKTGERCDLKKRTRQFALRVIRLYGSLGRDTLSQVLGKQVLRSGTSVGANYREASRARSDAEFVSKLGIAQQELEETLYWFELLVESNLIAERQIAELRDEANQLMAIFITIMRNRKKKPAAKSDETTTPDKPR